MVRKLYNHLMVSLLEIPSEKPKLVSQSPSSVPPRHVLNVPVLSPELVSKGISKIVSEKPNWSLSLLALSLPDMFLTSLSFQQS
jgi:hypothetical protein